MAEIPEDLRSRYAATRGAASSSGWSLAVGRAEMELIIAALEAELAAAREQLLMAHDEMATVNCLIVELSQTKAERDSLKGQLRLERLYNSLPGGGYGFTDKAFKV